MIYPRSFGNLPLDVRKHFNFMQGYLKKISGLSIIIPIRGLKRQANLEFVISRLLAQNVDPLEIIISEEDIERQVKTEKYNKESRIKKIFTLGKKEKFNKSIAINAAVSVSKYNKLLMNDADIVPPVGYLERVDKVLDTHESFFVGKTIYNVNLIKSLLSWQGSKRDDYFSGGSLGFTKDAFVRIGGMCELFEGYGSEDCEFFDRLRNKTNLYEERDSIFLHLNHSREHSFSCNVQIYEQIINMPMEQRLAFMQKQLNLRMS